MSCKNNFPIDITNNPKGVCNLKCKYSYKYNDSISTIKNVNNNYILLNYDRVNTYPVIFNSYPYYVSDIFIFRQSLHTYSGIKADGELLIRHMSDYNTILWVCIPIIMSDVKNKSSEILSNIISNASKYANVADLTTYLKESINITFLIPNKRFYSYKNCANDNFIVFSKDDGAFIGISELQLSELKNIIIDTSETVEVSKTDDFYVNNDGGKLLGDDITGDIYIDCKPVVDDGDIIDENISGLSSFDEMFSHENLKNFKDSYILKFILLLVFLLILYFLYKLLLVLINNLLDDDVEKGSINVKKQ